MTTQAQAALRRMQLDEDIQQEKYPGNQPVSVGGVPPLETVTKLRVEDTPFTLIPGTGGHRASKTTVALLHELGGVDALRDFTNRFYEHVKKDGHLDQFLREHNDPHGERFATWIAEKFGHGTPWSQEKATRRPTTFVSHGHRLQTPIDRSSAHHAAWHSPKRAARDFGKHFKLEDSRLWMRLHFLAMRESGAYDKSPAFCEYYIKFIGHFVSIYESSAPTFARESARWSANPANVAAYLENGRVMSDVIGVGLQEALRALPESEARDRNWPYTRR